MTYSDDNSSFKSYRPREEDRPESPKPGKLPDSNPEIPSPVSVPEENPGRNIEMPEPKPIPEMPVIPQEFPPAGYR